MNTYFTRWKNGLMLVLVLCAGIVIGFLAKQYLFSSHARGALLRAGQDELINPLLACEVADKQEFSEFHFLQKRLEDHVSLQLKKKAASDISVYFRTLNSGRWIGVNENQPFEPASLLKLPILIAYLKEVELEPSLLGESIRYSADAQKGETHAQHYLPLEYLTAGKEYTIEDLMKRMIAYSDNDAMHTLLARFGNEPIARFLSDVGIGVSADPTKQIDMLSARVYSYFFRILYSATYLGRETSKNTLLLLTKTAFDRGLTRGVPGTILVAHKFGERGIEQDSVHKELHDCGIVYYPGHPYFLCVMTRGDEFARLEEVIADISRMVYTEVDERIFRGSGSR